MVESLRAVNVLAHLFPHSDPPATSTLITFPLLRVSFRVIRCAVKLPLWILAGADRLPRIVRFGSLGFPLRRHIREPPLQMDS